MRHYVGIDQDDNGGMTMIARIVRDAWVFGILPETETCAGWSASDMQLLFEKVHLAWDPYGHLPSHLPPDLSERHARIHAAAMKRGRETGWDTDLNDDD